MRLPTCHCTSGESAVKLSLITPQYDITPVDMVPTLSWPLQQHKAVMLTRVAWSVSLWLPVCVGKYAEWLQSDA